MTSQSSASFSCADAADLAARRVLGARDVCLFRHGYIADGSRVHFVSAHAGGPYITVDRPSKGKLTLKQVADQGCMSANMATYLAAAVQHGRTIVVNSNDIDARFEFISALLGELTPTTRAICVDTGGRPAAPNTCSVILTAPGGQSTLSQALLMRPDYLVVADVTTTDPLQAVTAMSATTGGGILGVTADSPEDGLARLIRQSASHRSTQGEATGLLESCVRTASISSFKFTVSAMVRCESPKSWTWMEPFKKFIRALITSPRQVKCRDGTKTHLDSVRNYPTISLPRE